MAKETLRSAKLRLEFNVGLGEDGKAKIKSKTLSKLNKDADVDAIKSTAGKIGKLLSTPIVKTYKITESEITE
ncbi:Protein of unknown function [Peptoniphilus asaccharolyticus DSM 20463]|uniref:DUF1659 domain-containing protein n=1 Tax=Peptoniphilus asaccharolyticus DSM 20463 TaxID=573058 RepID=A0A1W1UGW2_PEPAS|nr:DUF1659 domain-containing protein [Peptoniphilus asaccharolyticus]MBL7574702.1 DUF1659 domain-containing protein [Peptoniphilus asaccharolyticus]SMB80310.1 Protein of unknown function [Peptoniphilus asaccharolyticus DSM 20463]